MPKEKKKIAKISKDTPIEEIVEKYPKAVGWLVQHGVICMACGEPYWGTLGELMEKKNIKDPEKLIKDLNELFSL
jgi:hypothetical protein